MDTYIITKYNNNIRKKYINKNLLNNYIETENIMSLLDLEKYNLDKDKIIVVNNFIRDILIKYYNSIDLNYILSILNSEKNEIEILNIYKQIIDNYDKITHFYPKKRKEKIRENLELCFNTNKQIIINIIIKELINNYCKKILNNISKNKLNKLYLKHLRNNDIKIIINELDIKLENKKYLSILEKLLEIKFNKIYENTFPHLCWEECANLHNCEKINDCLKNFITNYDFIKSGYQIININTLKNGKKYLTTDTFYVSECKNYVKIKTKNKKL